MVVVAVRGQEKRNEKQKKPVLSDEIPEARPVAAKRRGHDLPRLVQSRRAEQDPSERNEMEGDQHGNKLWQAKPVAEQPVLYMDEGKADAVQ